MENRGEVVIVLPQQGETVSVDEQQVRLASIVSIDVAGFSARTQRDQARAAREVEGLRARIASVAERNGGRVFNTAGDGFMLEFSSAGAAFAYIAELLDKRPRGEPPIRVGAHVGDVIVTITNDLLGHGVNVAARLQSMAKPGGALVSGEFKSMASNSPQAAFLSKGRQPLDNMSQKVQTFAIVSPRQRLFRSIRQAGAAAAAIAIAIALPFMYPKAVDIARAMGVEEPQLPQINKIKLPLNLGGAAPPAAPAAAPVSEDVVVVTPPAPAAPAPSAAPIP
jgi:class 3 adenylate cyclase